MPMQVIHSVFSGTDELVSFVLENKPAANAKVACSEENRKESINRTVHHKVDSWLNNEQLDVTMKRMHAVELDDIKEFLNSADNTLRGKMSDALYQSSVERGRVNVRELKFGNKVNAVSLLSGKQNSFSKLKTRWKERGRVIKIALEIGGNCDRTQEQLVCRSAAAAILCDFYEAQGISVELSGIFCNELYSEHMTLSEIVLKRPQDLYSLNNIAYVGGDAAFFRRFLLCASLITSPLHKGVPWGLGRATPLPRELRGMFDLVLDTNAITIESASNTITSQIKAFMANKKEYEHGQ